MLSKISIFGKVSILIFSCYLLESNKIIC